MSSGCEFNMIEFLKIVNLDQIIVPLKNEFENSNILIKVFQPRTI